MIGRALKGDVERDFHFLLAGCLHQCAKIVQRSQLGMHRFVSAFGCANRPDAADIARLALFLIIFPFAKRFANRMDRRQINYVETHSGDIRQMLDHVA